MQWLILKVSSTDAQTVEYALLSRQQQADTFSRSSWDSVKALAKGKRLLLLIPTEDVAMSTVDIPAKNHKLLAKAIPFSLEDHLAEDVESLHFVYHRVAADKPVHVAAMNQQRLQHWLDTLQAHALTPHAVLPDVFALPAEEDSLTVAGDGRRTLVRSGLFSGYVLDSELLGVLLPKVLEDESPQAVCIDLEGQNTDAGNDAGNSDDSIQKALADSLPESVKVTQAKHLSRQCDASLLQALPMNVLQQFQRKGQQAWTEHLSRWKSAAVLLLLLGVLWTLIIALQNYKLAEKLKQLDTRIAEVYSSTFPDARVDDDYRILHAAMAEKLKSIAPGAVSEKSSPLELLATITPTIKQFKDVVLSDLRFDQEGLKLIVSAPSLSQLEKFRAALDQGSVDAQVVSSTSSANKVESTLSIKKEAL